MIQTWVRPQRKARSTNARPEKTDSPIWYTSIHKNNKVKKGMDRVATKQWRLTKAKSDIDGNLVIKRGTNEMYRRFFDVYSCVGTTSYPEEALTPAYMQEP